MLRELHISNLAVIAEASMEFSPGLNIFTGQTGAGKSLLVGAIEFLLGLRGGGEQATGMIRPGAEEARVMGLFEIGGEALRKDLEGILDRPIDGGELLITRRLFATGRSSVSINGQPATAPMLRALGERLIDIHGQHDQQYLLKPANQRALLDAFAGCVGSREAFARTYRELQSLRSRREDLQSSASLRKQRLELLEYQVEEIDAAELSPGEFAAVEQDFVRLSNAGKLQHIAGGLVNALEVSEPSLNDQLRLLGRELETLAKLDPAGAGEIRDGFADAQAALDDLTRSLERYADNIELDEEALLTTEQRLDQLNRLIDKYAAAPSEDPVAAVLEYRDAIGAEVDALKAETADLTEMDDRIAALEAQLLEQGAALSKARKKAGKTLAPLIEAQLAELGMEQAAFEVDIDARPADDPDIGPSGFDAVEFLVRTNPGQTSQPLRQIASGGEISRIMLAIKSILAAGDQVPVLIFDEIDANIGGRLGSVVGRTLKKLIGDGHHQVLCITHLAQIAAFAETHLHIAKTVRGESTETGVAVLAPNARAAELAEMLAGAEATETTLTQARELLAAATS